MIISRKDNNPYLLIAGTDQPQRDPETGQPIANPNYGEVTTFEVPDPPAPTPNNPDNPYFGKVPLIPKMFWGLVLQVFIVMRGSNEAGLDRMARLLDSKRAVPVIKIVDSVSTIDPDDKDGAFLEMVALLTTTKHEGDGELLMTEQEVAGIMAAWRST